MFPDHKYFVKQSSLMLVCEVFAVVLTFTNNTRRENSVSNKAKYI